MSKWTKGEWRPGFNGLSVVSDCNDGLYISGTTGELAIDYCGGNLIAESVTPCNAKLIAQAPVLAERLATLIDVMVGEGYAELDSIKSSISTLQDAGYYD
jgi:hypothetical protein